MTEARTLLEKYVTAGKLMQIATLGADGAPLACSVWYDPHFAPDLLRWISRHDRAHSVNIGCDPRVAGAIVAIPLDGLGQTARGVSFIGRAQELPVTGIDQQVARFVARWPAAADALDLTKLAAGQTPTRLYEVAVTEWVLFDEENFPWEPRQTVAATGI
ncbi:pyridoxamine 5'-phosphate oxidase family protein [Streptosporangium sp. NBC_01755]|uniref:pyridoxamine 5'-phosphate oxidase family protein n=1 Tax=unclassified Streptosporangium TaxID=2632669 RepID=UPI002DD9A653|nr:MULTISPECIES: pyridoxamine 5'-phosphate oxidase family protein [unclassified Streptosporangium]WSA23206.1 pyridoxamine 5'-phosphate oxidase family protein [Streptosporangium sp. NBC_01810]WSC98655.1 pyridoxamine 5'-phosphate oxidase family protein [Streptosporangium sp. NBC_01755]